MAILAHSPDHDVRQALAGAAQRVQVELEAARGELADLEALTEDAVRYSRMGDSHPVVLPVETPGSAVLHKPDDVLFETDGLGVKAFSHWLWHQDAWLTEYSKQVARKNALAARRAAIEGDKARTTEVVSQRCQQANSAAGGPALVAGSIVAAEVLAADFPLPLQPWINTVATLEGELGKVTDAFNRLALAIGDSLNPPASQALRKQQADKTAALESARTELRQHHQRLAAELVQAASEGQEAARARIEQLTVKQPMAFPDGFAAAIAAARFDQAVLAELQAALTHP